MATTNKQLQERVDQLAQLVINLGQQMEKLMDQRKEPTETKAESTPQPESNPTPQPNVDRENKIRERILTGAVRAKREEKKMAGTSWFQNKSGLWMCTFLHQGPCYWHGLLEQNPNTGSWLAELVNMGWEIYWVTGYKPRPISQGEDPTCDKCSGTGIYEHESGRVYNCLACKGLGKKLTTVCTNYLVIVRPGEQPEVIKVVELKKQLGIEPGAFEDESE